MGKKTKTKKKIILKKPYLIIGIISFVFILMIGSIIGLNQTVNNLNENANVQSLAFYIREANNNLSREAPTASYSSVQFIDEMKIKFDNSSSVKIFYTYNSADKENDLEEYVTVTSSSLKQTSLNSLYSVTNHEDFFDLIPGVQACQRPFMLTTDNEHKELYGNYSYLDSVKLQDGRLINILNIYDQLCPQAEFLNNELLSIIKRVQSY